jgi:hypothetical protein
MVCREHLTKWCFGINLLTPHYAVVCELEGEAAAREFHRDNLELLASCRTVQPFFPPPDQIVEHEPAAIIDPDEIPF